MAQKETHILFITTQLPFPPKSGGTVKSWKYINDLNQRYQLTVASLLKDDDEQHLQGFEQNIKLFGLITQKHQTKRSLLTLLKSYLGFPCLNVYRNYSKVFKNKLKPAIEQADVIIADHYEMFQYVPKEYEGKVVLHSHNAEFMLWKRLSELESNPLKKVLLKLEATRVGKYEQSIFDYSDLVYATESDFDLYKEHSFILDKTAPTYHLGNDELLNLEDLKFEDTELALTFMGTLSWEPNIDGLLWFIKEVWPIIKQKHAAIKLYILGKDPDPRLTKAASEEPNIKFTGFVKDLDTYLKKTRVYLAPLRFGSGMKVKVLEGLYRGVPTVSTSVGAEGLKLTDNESIMIADESALFAEKCHTLLTQQDIWMHISKQSRMLAEENYRWEPLFQKMDEALSDILD